MQRSNRLVERNQRNCILLGLRDHLLCPWDISTPPTQRLDTIFPTLGLFCSDRSQLLYDYMKATGHQDQNSKMPIQGKSRCDTQ